MSKTSPAVVFEEAQGAMAEGDWVTFFGCLDRHDLQRLISNGISLSLTFQQGHQAVLEAECQKHDFPLAEVVTFWNARQSKPYQKAVDSALKRVADWPGFMATLEQHTRRCCGGGSVSSSLFVGEQLRNVALQGDQARGICKITADFSEPVGFVCRKGRWFIRLFVGRR
jgi:hypothetical protein